MKQGKHFRTQKYQSPQYKILHERHISDKIPLSNKQDHYKITQAALWRIIYTSTDFNF
jgi:hypothetical protein